MNTPNVLRFALFLALFAVGCGTPNWAVRETAPCPESLHAPRANQERAYLAALLALSDRHYDVVHREAPRSIEAVARNRHYEFETTWVITIRTDGTVLVDQPENARETHEFTDNWHTKRVRSLESYRCRDLDWLRWNAESRGLVPVGAAGMIDAGGETPVTP